MCSSSLWLMEIQVIQFKSKLVVELVDLHPFRDHLLRFIFFPKERYHFRVLFPLAGDMNPIAIASAG